MHQLAEKYKELDQVIFHGPEYGKKNVQNLRYFCRYYIHGHSAGGTNPSLLEAMACSSRVIAHDNPFNRSVLYEDAAFFSNAGELGDHFTKPVDPFFKEAVANNLEKIRTKYNWDVITDAYEKLFYEVLDSR
jgi:glycosyltransferase involved in cell wall biosynthesis